MSGNKELTARHSGITRRDFLGTTAVVSAAATFTALSSTRVLGANERLGVGVIGAGGRGNSHLTVVRKIQDESNVDLVAVCDVYRPRAQKAAEKYKVSQIYTDHRELLADPKVDVVSIATPDHIHGYQAIDALQAGKDVYCEKPVTHWRQFKLTRRLAREVENSKQVFQLGTQGMSDDAWALMRQLVRDGLIGQPIHAECGYFRVGDWGERGMPVDDPNAQAGPDLNWKAFLGDSPKRRFDVSRFFRWRMYEDYAGGPVTDLYPHSLTPVVSILGVNMPTSVVAAGGKLRYEEREVPDSFDMLISYPEKVTVAVLGTQGNNYCATGSRGSGSRIPVVQGWEGSITVQGSEVVFIPAEGSKKEAKRFPIERKEDFSRFWTTFFDCCRRRDKNTLSTMSMGYAVQTALQMGMLAYREEGVARFDAKKESIRV